MVSQPGAITHAPEGMVDREMANATHGKVGMWIYLVTDAMTFGGLLIGYAWLRAKGNWPDPAEHLGIQLSGIATFILICSSVSMVLAIRGATMNDRKKLIGWLSATILGGVVFLGIQYYEYTHLIHHGMSFAHFHEGNNLFGSTFYAITGFHGAHVLTGVIYLTVILIKSLGGRYDGDPSHVEIAGLFWHFVDLIWILVFTFIYLL
jgi:heme/copper-type cytochrome/quinol oxidase subunit 3